MNDWPSAYTYEWRFTRPDLAPSRGNSATVQRNPPKAVSKAEQPTENGAALRALSQARTDNVSTTEQNPISHSDMTWVRARNEPRRPVNCAAHRESVGRGIRKSQPIGGN